MGRLGVISDDEGMDRYSDESSSSVDGDVESMIGTEEDESDQNEERDEGDDSMGEGEEGEQGEPDLQFPWQEAWNPGSLPYGYPPGMVPGPSGAMWYNHPGLPLPVQYPHGYPNPFPMPPPGYANYPPTYNIPQNVPVVADVGLEPSSHRGRDPTWNQDLLPPHHSAIKTRASPHQLKNKCVKGAHSAGSA
ncbi:hypothetical protein GY45DRAFT_1375558 [Cubamyces sp. BRFM 1775]|nr:hypothetical protein GY45DRAFT_1375558 [Cubamyces sp. BRFM 1775]